jgi:hypothetical protein
VRILSIDFSGYFENRSKDFFPASVHPARSAGSFRALAPPHGA